MLRTDATDPTLRIENDDPMLSMESVDPAQAAPTNDKIPPTASRLPTLKTESALKKLHLDQSESIPEVIEVSVEQVLSFSCVLHTILGVDDGREFIPSDMASFVSTCVLSGE